MKLVPFLEIWWLKRQNYPKMSTYEFQTNLKDPRLGFVVCRSLFHCFCKWGIMSEPKIMTKCTPTKRVLKYRNKIHEIQTMLLHVMKECAFRGGEERKKGDFRRCRESRVLNGCKGDKYLCSTTAPSNTPYRRCAHTGWMPRLSSFPCTRSTPNHSPQHSPLSLSPSPSPPRSPPAASSATPSTASPALSLPPPAAPGAASPPLTPPRDSYPNPNLLDPRTLDPFPAVAVLLGWHLARRNGSPRWPHSTPCRWIRSVPWSCASCGSHYQRRPFAPSTNPEWYSSWAPSESATRRRVDSYRRGVGHWRSE